MINNGHYSVLVSVKNYLKLMDKNLINIIYNMNNRSCIYSKFLRDNYLMI